MRYYDAKTPSQLLRYMEQNIKYGFVDDNLKEYSCCNSEEFQKNFRTKWKLSSPERLRKVRYGTCFDQVELEREWFKKNNYEFKTIYIWFCLPYDNSYSIHTYLIFEENGKYYYFEHADSSNSGIYKFNTYEEAINFQKEKHIESNRKRNHVGDRELKCIRIYEYQRPIFGCNMEEFINNILENGIEL